MAGQYRKGKGVMVLGTQHVPKLWFYFFLTILVKNANLKNNAQSQLH